MRLVIQRVLNASVLVENLVIGKIDSGLLILVGFSSEDTDTDIQWAIKKLLALRIFKDDSTHMNLSVSDVSGEILIVSQFTLFASIIKGNRPSFGAAAPPEIAIKHYTQFVQTIKACSNLKVETGRFGADMQVVSENDGPVTILIDTKNKE